MNRICITLPYDVGIKAFVPNKEYHFAINKGEYEHWSFWVLDKINVYDSEEGSEFEFKLAPGWE